MVTFCEKMCPNEQNQICRTGNGQILYGMVRRIGKAMRQKHCGYSGKRENRGDFEVCGFFEVFLRYDRLLSPVEK